MPPVHELHAVHRIQKNLRPDLIASLLSPLKRRVLEHQTNTVVAHVSAHVDCELSAKRENQIRGLVMEEKLVIHLIFLIILRIIQIYRSEIYDPQ